jgi:hypothetical protein
VVTASTDEPARVPALLRGLGLVAGFLALAALPTLGLGLYAAADTTGETGSSAPLAAAPTPPVAGAHPVPATTLQHDAFRGAASGCTHATDDAPRPSDGLGQRETAV